MTEPSPDRPKEGAEGEQLELLDPSVPRRRSARSSTSSAARATAGAATMASKEPVASVIVDTGLAHLDRPFEYLVPESMAEAAVPGARVKVRFAGQDLDGFIVERSDRPEHEGRLSPLRRVVSPESVLTPATLEVAREVARHYAGTLGDVLRLAVPPRHAAAERALSLEAPTPDPLPAPTGPGPWSRYAAGPAFLQRLAARESPAASWLALPAPEADGDWPVALASAAAATLTGGRGSVIVVPDRRDVARVDAALAAALGPGRHVRLTADQGPQARYTAWLKVLRGHVSVVVGTRAAAFAPVRDLGLLAWWDDGDDLLEEPRSPYPHVREVLRVRARHEGAALLSAGFTRSVAVQALVESGELRPILATSGVRAAVPRVHVAGEGVEQARDPAAASAHLPSVAWRTAKTALESGPVLVQVPRRGYLPSMSCQTCRTPARCGHCGGPLALAGRDAEPACRWCGRGVGRFTCRACQGHTLRSAVVGARRTAEELGRAFPGVPVHTSGSGAVLDTVAATAALVIATPGAEPVAEGGYAAVLLLDAWASLDRPTLNAGEESLRRWLAAAALTRPSSRGGEVVLCGAPQHTTLPVVEALVRWDPVWFAERELEDRRGLNLPPVVSLAAVTGERRAVDAALRQAVLPPDVERLGPLPVGPDTVRVLLRARSEQAPELAAALGALRAVRSARKETASIHIAVDPPDLAS